MLLWLFLKEQSNAMQDDDQDDNDDVIDSETEEVLSEFNFLSAHQSNTTVVNTNISNTKNLDIGELANITPNENDLWPKDDDKAKERSVIDQKEFDNVKTVLIDSKQQEWNPKFVLKSHFDCVRCLKFHFKEPLIVTGSEDETIKLWNLNKTPMATNKHKVIPQDIEPIFTYRGHKSPVLCLIIVENQIFSGGSNGEILIWKIPENYSTMDPYETYDPSIFLGNLDGHKDAIWSLVGIPSSNESKDLTNSDDDDLNKQKLDLVIEQQPKIKIICSASADGTIKIWDIETKECIKTIVYDESLGKTTCLAALPLNATLDSSENVDTTNKSSNNNSLSQYLAVSFTKGFIQIYDINSSNYSQPVLIFESLNKNSKINSIVVHPTLTIIVSAHEDRNIRFWDYTTGKCTHEMTAHLAEITSLDIDLEGLYLLSCGHDCSVRLWNFETKRCIKEAKSHIEKFSEAIFEVCFHPTQKLFATGGADARARIFSKLW